VEVQPSPVVVVAAAVPTPEPAPAPTALAITLAAAPAPATHAPTQMAAARAAINTRAVAAPTQPVTAGLGSIQSDSRTGTTTPLLPTPAGTGRQPATSSGRCCPQCVSEILDSDECGFICPVFMTLVMALLYICPIIFFMDVHGEAQHSDSPYAERFCGNGYVNAVHCGSGDEYRKSSAPARIVELTLSASHVNVNHRICQ
jgi:hypothetical protein